MADLHNTVLDGRYQLLQKIGAGAMGEVWRARQQSLNRDVAIKVMVPGAGTTGAPEKEEIERFQREARAISRVKHDNVVVVFDTGRCAATNLSFIAMELLAGQTLRQRMRAAGALPEAEATAIVRQLAAALAAAHGAGIVHRDVKPENVFVLDAPAGRVKLLDFGIARSAASGDTLTARDIFVGTPAYAAPEVIVGASTHDPKSDVYSLGVVWFELIAGRKPFDAKSALAVAVAQAHDPAPRLTLPGLPSLVIDTVARMLAKDPAQRPTLAAVLRAIDGDADPPPHAPPAPHAPRHETTDFAASLASAPTVARASHTAFENAWFTVQLDEARRVLRITRTAAPLTLEQVDEAFAFLGVEPAGLPIHQWGALMDLRAVVGKNTDAFEQRARPHFARVASYARTAFLVRSEVGKLNLDRNSRNAADASDLERVLITRDEVEALAFVAQR